MRPARLLLAALLGALALPAFPAPAAEPAAKPQPDPGLAPKLKEIGYEYEIDDDGDYKLVLGVEGERTQLVFVRSAVEAYGSHRVREIWSPAYAAPEDAFPAAVANRLLEASSDLKLGSWIKQGRYAVLVVKLDAEASPLALEDAIEAAALGADRMEASLAEDPAADEF
ncbi:MAG TPA: hypothetical protein VFF91_11040 [Pseudoxanthomonas sp.]|nr:hypothetical protein [Pseudoxanthomonas sp.]